MKKKDKRIEKELKETIKFFRKVAKSGVQINATQAVREERDRDNPKKNKSKPKPDPINAFLQLRKTSQKLSHRQMKDAIHKGRI